MGRADVAAAGVGAPTLTRPAGYAEEQIPALRAALLAWWDAGHRELPWRKTREPYAVLVSELMLQQTQADRVAARWPAFMRRFPTLLAVAAAPMAAVIDAWAGLGYNRRAVNLHRLSQAVLRDYGGVLPASVPALEVLPGIGPYTARAVASIAFGVPAAAVDTNVRRVLTRVFDGTRAPPPARVLQQRADAVLLPERPGDWNQAVMELGAVVCPAAAPRCTVCPLARMCAAAPDVRAVREQGATYRTAARPQPQRPFAGSARFYRGRIVDLLRAPDAREGLGPMAIGARLRLDFDESMRPWLETLLEGLQRDGLLYWPGDDAPVRLPR